MGKCDDELLVSVERCVGFGGGDKRIDGDGARVVVAGGGSASACGLLQPGEEPVQTSIGLVEPPMDLVEEELGRRRDLGRGIHGARVPGINGSGTNC